MCLTIPKKVIEIRNGGDLVVEDMDGQRQDVKSMIEVGIGDIVLVQQNVIIEKIDDESYQEMLKILKNTYTGGKN